MTNRPTTFRSSFGSSITRLNSTQLNSTELESVGRLVESFQVDIGFVPFCPRLRLRSRLPLPFFPLVQLGHLFASTSTSTSAPILHHESLTAFSLDTSTAVLLVQLPHRRIAHSPFSVLSFLPRLFITSFLSSTLLLPRYFRYMYYRRSTGYAPLVSDWSVS